MVEIKIITKQKSIITKVDEKKTILDAIKQNQIVIQAYCDGRGTCGKCKVRLNGAADDVLACKNYPSQGMVVELVQDTKKLNVLSEFINADPLEDSNGIYNTTKNITKNEFQKKQPPQQENKTTKYVVAVDLGTTTVVIQLLRFDEITTKLQVVQTVRSLNPQSSYGADVISRMTAATQGAAKELSACIRKLICDSIETMCQTQGLTIDQLAEIAIAGNTTMLHLLQEYDVSGLGKHPFTPVTLQMEKRSYEELKSGNKSIHGSQNVNANEGTTSNPQVTILPGISAFVGADITAGMLALGMHRSEKINLLVDLGTNGEMAIGNRERILVTSTAAGPAFEGGNLSCGVGSMPGAITKVSLKRRYAVCETIDNQPAIGFCGTGAVSMLSNLWTQGLIDEHGSFLEDKYRQNGYSLNLFGTTSQICFTQEDVRQMQLAKGAIRAGMEVLMQQYQANNIEHLYLAGGMGFSMDTLQASSIGLIPPEMKEKVKAVGNSCLGGLIYYLTATLNGKDVEQEISRLLNHVKSIQLASEEIFSGEYLTYMEFQNQ